MRVGFNLVVAFCATVGAATAHAQTGPVIVIPGKAGVPVTINGVIVDGALIYGDWGLARPGHGQIIIQGPIALAANDATWDLRGYFPATGHRPRYGRHEIEPPRRPRPSTNFHRDWSIESEFRKPVTEYPPIDPPPVVMAPPQWRHK